MSPFRPIRVTDRYDTIITKQRLLLFTLLSLRLLGLSPLPLLLLLARLGRVRLGLLPVQLFLFVGVTKPLYPGIGIVSVVDQFPDPFHLLLFPLGPLQPVVFFDPSDGKC